MTRINLKICTVLIFLLLAASCILDEAETINPADETYTNTATAVGNITTLTATISNLSQTNPYITIIFSSPIDRASIDYASSIVIVDDPLGTPTTLTQGTQYSAIPTPGASEPISKITLNFTTLAPSTADVIRVTLTNGITSYNNSSVTLSTTGNFDKTVQ